MDYADDYGNAPDLMVQIGKRVRAARKAAGLTQQEAATRAGLGQEQFSRMETGRLETSLRNLARTAASLDVPLAHLVADLDLSGVRLEKRSYDRQGLGER